MIKNNHRRIPHFEKIIIGPCMILGEMITGGHYIETLKIIKQSTNLRYSQIVKDLWYTHRIRGFYLGFWPWSFLQITKGLPVLFVQAESYHVFKKYTLFSDSTSQLISGILGGMSQGIFVTPTQRLKTIIMTQTQASKNQSSSSFQIIKNTYKTGGICSFFYGLTPMVLRRGIDWGLRFFCFHFLQNQRMKNKGELSLFDNVLCGIGAGFFATITTPIDTCISESQKYSNTQNSLPTIVTSIYKKDGLKGFVRGWNVRVLHSCYHTAWICGIGNVVFSFIRNK